MKNTKFRHDPDDFELLVSHNRKRHTPSSARLKWYLALLVAGIVGSAGCLWAMFYTSRSEAVAHKLGLTRVANSLENILDLLALPVLMFTVILTIYASQRLYRIYKEANDPLYFRRGQ